MHAISIMQAVNTVKDSVKSQDIVFDFSRAVSVDIHGNGNSLVVTAIGVTVVFLALLLIYWIFLALTKVLKIFDDLKHKQSLKASEQPKPASDLNIEVNAAIAMALHLYFQQIHDYENTVLTINKVSRTYSPWSSKIYNLRRHPKLW